MYLKEIRETCIIFLILKLVKRKRMNIKLLKRGYGSLLSSILGGQLLFCGGAEALPQDWNCDAIDVVKVEEVADSMGFLQLLYVGERDGVRLRIAFDIDEDDGGKVVLDCGNQGCLGEFEDITSGKREEFYFYCEQQQGNRVSCSPVIWRHWRLKSVGNGRFEMTMCRGERSYQLDVKDCRGDSCLLHGIVAGEEWEGERFCKLWGDGDGMVCLDTYEMEWLREGQWAFPDWSDEKF